MKFIKNWYIVIITIIFLTLANLLYLKEISNHSISILFLSLLLKIAFTPIDRDKNYRFIQILNPIIMTKLCDYIIQKKSQFILNNENYEEFDSNNFFKKYKNVKFIFGKEELSYNAVDNKEINLYKKVLEDLNKKINIVKEYELFMKSNSQLFLKNFEFLEKINDNELEKLFEYMSNKIKDIQIVYENNYEYDKDINEYYNKFFSRYKKIVIDQYNIIEKVKETVDNVYNYINVTLVSEEGGIRIYIKNNSKNNGIYDADIDSQEDIDEEKNTLSIYYYLNHSIGSAYMIDMEKEYWNLKK